MPVKAESVTKKPQSKAKKLLQSGSKLAMLLILFVISAIFMHDKFAGCFRLYSEIGATPWHRPDTLIKADHSEKWSDGEISKALLAAEALYESEYYAYNEVYLISLSYDDGFDREKQGAVSDRYVYLRCELKIGYSRDAGNGSGLSAAGTKGSTVTDVYWTVEHMPDGSWHCTGWAQD